MAVVVDVIRAFTTAAYAFAAGATSIYLADTVEEALDLGNSFRDALVLGEDQGRQPPGFHLPNSPVAVLRADVAGRTLVQRTSAGTRAVVAASSVKHVFAASLVCASATAKAVRLLTPEAPTYVISGRFPDDADSGSDDLLTAQLIERARRNEPLEAQATADAVGESPEAMRTLAIGAPHVEVDDISYARAVDAFNFAMRVQRADGLQWLVAQPFGAP